MRVVWGGRGSVTEKSQTILTEKSYMPAPQARKFLDEIRRTKLSLKGFLVFQSFFQTSPFSILFRRPATHLNISHACHTSHSFRLLTFFCRNLTQLPGTTYFRTKPANNLFQSKSRRPTFHDSLFLSYLARNFFLSLFAYSLSFARKYWLKKATCSRRRVKFFWIKYAERSWTKRDLSFLPHHFRRPHHNFFLSYTCHTSHSVYSSTFSLTVY